MNANVAFNLLSFVCYGAALACVFHAMHKRRLVLSVSVPLALSLAFYVYVSISNILEHLGWSNQLDASEDIAEVVFCLVILFFANNWRAHHAVEVIRNQKDWLAVTLHSIGDAVIATDVEGRVTMMNQVAERLTGWSGAEATGKEMDEIFRITDPETGGSVESPVHRVLQTGEVVSLTEPVSLLSRCGTSHRIADSGAPIRNESGEILGVVLVFRDVTEKHLMEEKLRHSQKMDAIGKLAGGVAHDFNNMLGGILGSAELLQVRLAKDPETAPFVETIAEAAERAADLTSKLLSFSRRTRLDLTPIDIRDPIREAVELLKHSIDPRIRIETRLPNHALMVVGDSVELQGSLMNLLINASHAMPDGGQIEISAARRELDLCDCSSSSLELKPGTYVEIAVRDDGCGIARDDRSRIFEPFFTTKPKGKGTGLGLSTVFGTVRQHQGAIDVESEVGLGTTFRVYLPLAAGDDTKFVRRESATPVCGHGCILVVDDESTVRVIAGAILNDLGYDVLMAEDGRQALTMFREHRRKIDLVLLDMIMPNMNGYDCLAALREIEPDVRVLMMSGYAREDDLETINAAGVKGFLRKPYRSVALSRAVYEAMHT